MMQTMDGGAAASTERSFWGISISLRSSGAEEKWQLAGEEHAAGCFYHLSGPLDYY